MDARSIQELSLVEVMFKNGSIGLATTTFALSSMTFLEDDDILLLMDAWVKEKGGKKDVDISIPNSGK